MTTISMETTRFGGWIESVLAPHRTSERMLKSAMDFTNRVHEALGAWNDPSPKQGRGWVIIDVPWPDAGGDDSCALWGPAGAEMTLGPFERQKRVYVWRGKASISADDEPTACVSGTGKRDAALAYAELSPGKEYRVRALEPTRFVLNFRPELPPRGSRKADPNAV